MLKHYVEFDTPGALFPETEIRLVKTRIPANLFNIPKYTYALNYYDREEIVKDNEKLKGKPKNKSKRIVFGEVYTKEDIIKEGYGEHTPLYRNADNSNGKLIKCITGNWQPWDKNWIILKSYEELNKLRSNQ